MRPLFLFCLRGRPTNQWRSFFQSKIPKTCSVSFLPACTQTFVTSVTMPARCQNNHDEHRTKMVVTAIAVSPDCHYWSATLFGGYHWREREWYICIICVVDLTLLLTRILRRLQVPVVLHVTWIVTPTACRGKQKRRRKWTTTSSIACLLMFSLFWRLWKQSHPCGPMKDANHFVNGMAMCHYIRIFFLQWVHRMMYPWH